MRKLISILLLTIAFGCGYAQPNVIRQGNTFKTEKVSSQPVQTKYTWVDREGKSYPIYISPSGSGYIIKISKKTGNEYKQYLKPEISKQICKELNIEYKSKNK